MKHTFLLIVILSSLTFATQAKEQFVELDSRITKFYVKNTVNDDLTHESITEVQVQALTDESAKKIKNRRFSHSTSIEKMEVLEAYTLKPDGKKIPVPENNYQITINKGKDTASAIFSDRTTITVVFPEFVKNDSAYIKYKRIEKEPMFPGHFSVGQYFYSQNAYDDVQLRFDFPETIDLKYEVRKMKENTYIKNGRRIFELSYSNSKPIKSKRINFSVWDNSGEAGYAFSTFNSYKAIANAYASRALPKSKPNKRIHELAKDILKGEKNKKTQARLLYDWVALNISYAGNCIGVGAVVPHDTDFILNNRMGDCKDHATLLEALYNSVGIESKQALINSGSIYTLSKIPLVSSVNHVINYLPEWDQFVDSTNPHMPFDRLSFSLQDKPTILITDGNPIKKTPAMKPTDNYQKLESTMTIRPDGSVKGEATIYIKGFPAVEFRKGWRNVTKQQEEDWLKKIFSTQNKRGFATITKDDPTPLLSEMNYNYKFTRPDVVLPQGAGGFYITPLVPNMMGVFQYIDYPKESVIAPKINCGNGSAYEKLVYLFPEKMKILAKPNDFSIKENYIEYTSSYSLKKNKLVVIRKIIDNSPANVCSKELVNQQRETLIKITESLRSQVVYQH